MMNKLNIEDYTLSRIPRPDEDAKTVSEKERKSKSKSSWW